jgi:hypothetical protein
MSALKQQINLYRPVTDTTRVPFSARSAALLLGLAAAGLVFVWAYGLWRVQRLERTVGLLREQQQHHAKTLETLSAARATGMSPEQITAQVAVLAAELATHSRALDLLRSGSVGETGGFSNRLSALARHPMEGLWIDRVLLSSVGTPKMSLGGMAIDPELVPRYLHELRAEPALAGLRFEAFAIEQPTTVKAAARGSEHKFIFKAESDAAAPPAPDSRS